MLPKGHSGDLEVRDLGQNYSPSRLEGKCLLVCVTVTMSHRREYLGSSLAADLTLELNVIERATCKPELCYLCPELTARPIPTSCLTLQSRCIESCL